MEDIKIEKLDETTSSNYVDINEKTLEGNENVDMSYIFRVQYRFFRKRFKLMLQKSLEKTFKQILIITDSEFPSDYIHAFQKQYPNKIIKIIKPLFTKERNVEKSIMKFEFYSHNTKIKAELFKLKKTRDNIEVYGLHIATFESLKDISNFFKIEYLSSYVKALREVVKKIKPNVVHSDNLPFFLGFEFENKKRYPIKVFQIVKDFLSFEVNKNEYFWSAINLVDSAGMKKICRDKIVKKCIASLFNLHNTKRFYQMRDCLDFIYKNYERFRKYVDKCDDIEENILFNRLNSRILTLFPQIKCGNDNQYNLIYNSIKESNAWGVISQSYYNDLFDNVYEFNLDYLELYKEKSYALDYGCNLRKEPIYQEFNKDNFRELRGVNKDYLIKEFSQQRVLTKFSDITLFENENFEVLGYLDSFYDAPLIFCSFLPEIYRQGVDIAFHSILKLFERNKNIQIIINIPNGLSNNYIKSWIDFIARHSDFNGRWVFINTYINYDKFFAGSDIILLPKRENIINPMHLLAMNYGCIPVASKNGIYNDTVADIFSDMTNGCGFKTKTSLSSEQEAIDEYLTILTKALNLYTQNPASWNLLIKNCMDYNSEWTFQAIEMYNFVYEKLMTE